MPKLHDILDPVDLAQAIHDGYVRTQTHPSLPLAIYNYSEKAAYESVWTPITRQCRGLIVNLDTAEVIARPFPKFMNVGQDGAYTGRPDEPVVVSEKHDGSLGIGYPTADGWAIATRGSFASEQADHATRLYHRRYADTQMIDGLTPLWEIVYPANRIVVDYQGLDDLILLGAVDITAGRSYSPPAAADLIRWAGPVAEVFEFATFADAIAAPPRSNREGFVIHFTEPDERTKWKYDEYVQLHKIVTGMNERVVWEHLGSGGTVDELAAPLPDEFHPWVHDVADRLRHESGTITASAARIHDAIVGSLPDGWARKDYAIAAQAHPTVRPYLFLLLDSRDPQPAIWKTLRPSGANTMTSWTEDAA